jgi:hypothetical protein
MVRVLASTTAAFSHKQAMPLAANVKLELWAAIEKEVTNEINSIFLRTILFFNAQKDG